MNLTKTIITSNRLILIPVSEKYAQTIFTEFNPEITTYMFPKPSKNIEEVLEFIRSSKEKLIKGEELIVGVLEKETKIFLGCGGIHQINTEVPEIGIWIKKSAHGNKFGREAVEALINWLKQNYSYKYIKYPVDKRNIASRKIPESLGGVVKAEYKKTSMAGKVLDELEYHIY